MCKKLMMLCLMLGLASAAYAYTVPDDYADVQIADWEGSMDAWESWNAKNIISYSDVGVTSGSYSLRVDSNKPTSNYWYSQELNYKFIGEEARNAYFGNNIFSLDVSTLMAEWIVNTNAGWIWGTDMGLVMNAGDNQGRSMWTTVSQTFWRPDLADYSATLSWDYSDVKRTLLSWALNEDYTEGWVEFVILVRYPTFESPPDGTGDGGIYYLDNGWISGTPEPTTIVLLGLGSLALLRRKR